MWDVPPSCLGGSRQLLVLPEPSFLVQGSQAEPTSPRTKKLGSCKHKQLRTEVTHLLPDLLELGQWEVATEENGQPVHFLWSDLWRREYTTILASWIEFDIYVQRAYSFTCAAGIKWPALFHWLLNPELPSKGQSQNKAKRDWDINSTTGSLIDIFQQSSSSTNFPFKF